MKLAEASRIEDVVSKPLSFWQISFQRRSRMPFKMAEFCQKNKGIGLAAPQIGLFERFFVARVRGLWNVFYNPKITWISEETNVSGEGCLSYPGLTANIWRPKEILITFLDGIGRIKSEKYAGFDAVVVQHECDHLDGITISTRINKGKASVSNPEQEKEHIYI